LFTVDSDEYLNTDGEVVSILNIKLGKEVKLMNYNKKANMGMGTLIIFIAMIIVAAIAASVLISTTTSLQNKALETGTATKDEVGTSLTVLQVFGEDGTNGVLENITVTTKLKAGSEPIRFGDLLVSLGLENVSEDYTYNSSVSGFGYYFDGGSLNSSKDTDAFFVNYSIRGNNFQDGFLSTGDVAKIQFVTPRTVGESESFNLDIVPKVGLKNSVETQTPTLILNEREPIFP
jgi:archaellin